MKALLCVVLLLLFAVPASAQDHSPSDTVRVVLSTGTSHIGVIQSETDSALTFRTLDGIEMQIPRQSVSRIEPVRGKFWRVDPNGTRLFFAPTARPLGHMKGYVADYQLFLPFVAVGVGPNVNLAGGISIVPISPSQIVYFAPKATLVNRDNLSFAVGGIVGTVVGSESGGSFAGAGFGVVSLGSEFRSISIAAGPVFETDENVSRLLIMLGGEVQITNSIKLMTENYVIPAEKEGYLITAGVRFFGDRLATDFALITHQEMLTEGGWPFFPWLGFAYNFGR